MFIQSKGIQIDNFYIPPFQILQGEVVVISLCSGGHFFDIENKLINIFNGNNSNKNVIVKKAFHFIDNRHAFHQNRIMEWFNILRVEKYLKKFPNIDTELLDKIYALDYVSPKRPIIRLPYESRKLLALYANFSKNIPIIFDSAGDTPFLTEKIYEIVKERIQKTNSAAILIDRDDTFKTQCSRFIQIEKN